MYSLFLEYPCMQRKFNAQFAMVILWSTHIQVAGIDVIFTIHSVDNPQLHSRGVIC